MNIDHRPHFPHDWRRAADERDVEKRNGKRGTSPLSITTFINIIIFIFVIIFVIVIQSNWSMAADEGDVEKTNGKRGTFPLPSSLRKQMAIEEGPPQGQEKDLVTNALPSPPS